MGMKSDDENQNIEWKWSWNDEYLKWLCGYANVKGGTLYIGVNDDGYVVGLENARLLLEQLPNKIITKLGIVAQIKKNLLLVLDIISVIHLKFLNILEWQLSIDTPVGNLIVRM